MGLIPIEGHDGLGKDPLSGAIVNTDREALIAARKRKAAILEDKEKLSTLETRVAHLEKLLEKVLGAQDGS